MKAGVERLYLHREKGQEIFTDLRKPLMQHQIDGIRFLFKEFKKKSPGVIVNDPAGYGKCLQVVLFLNATRLHFNKPILILTYSVDLWKNLFDEWTDLSEEIGTRCENKFAKTIMINEIEDGFKMSQRSWSIVVLHNNDLRIDSSNHFLKMKFNAHFKIWIASKDLKDNLRQLSTVYEWLHPEQKFNIQSFTAKHNDWKDKIQKMIFLDAFLEDVLIRRVDLLLHFEQNNIEKSAQILPENVTSRKNKDPTGTKVKRSKKRKIEDDHNDESPAVKQVPKVNNELTPDLEEKMDIEDFIVKFKPISEPADSRNGPSTKGNADNIGSIIKTGTKSQVSNIININKNNLKEHEVKIEEESCLTEYENLNESKTVEIEEMVKISKETSKILVPETEYDIDESQNESVGNKTTFIAETEDSQKTDVYDRHNTEVYENSTLKWDDNAEIISDNSTNVSNDAKPMSEDKNDTNTESTEDLNEISTLKYEDTEVTNTEDCSKENGSKMDEDISIEGTSKINNKRDHDNTNSKSNEISSKSFSDLDDELAAYEAKALQRLKGSILDRIF